VAFRRYRENAGTTARLTYTEFTNASNEFQRHETRNQVPLPFDPADADASVQPAKQDTPFHDAFTNKPRVLPVDTAQILIPPVLDEPLPTTRPSGAAQVTNTPQPTMPVAISSDSAESGYDQESDSDLRKGKKRLHNKKTKAKERSRMSGAGKIISQALLATHLTNEYQPRKPIKRRGQSQRRRDRPKQPLPLQPFALLPSLKPLSPLRRQQLQLSEPLDTTPPTSSTGLAPYLVSYGNYDAAYGAGYTDTNYAAAVGYDTNDGAGVGYDTNYDANNINEDGFEDQRQQDFNDDALTNEFHNNKHQINQIPGTGGGVVRSLPGID
jgi:hypothetical protein